MTNQYKVIGNSVIEGQQVSNSDTQCYGIIDSVSIDDKLIEVNKFVEMSTLGTSPLNYAIMGYYILTSEIFDFYCVSGEIQSIYGYEFEGKRFDIGEKYEFIETTIEFDLKLPELRDQLLE